MKLRRINVKRLGWSGVVYRIFIICCNAIFFKFGIKIAMEKYGAFGASICWNGINMCLYYLYHYWFLRMFKMGVE